MKTKTKIRQKALELEDYLMENNVFLSLSNDCIASLEAYNTYIHFGNLKKAIRQYKGNNKDFQDLLEYEESQKYLSPNINLLISYIKTILGEG